MNQLFGLQHRRSEKGERYEKNNEPTYSNPNNSQKHAQIYALLFIFRFK